MVSYEKRNPFCSLQLDERIGFLLRLTRKKDENMFEQGEFIVYGQSGICKVEGTTHLDMSGADASKLYYVLSPLNSKSGKIYSPVDNTKVVWRYVMSEDEAKDLVDEIPQIEQLWITNDKAREEKFKEAMKTCDCKQWVQIIKTLYIRKQDRIAQGKKTTYTDEKYLKQAEENLYGELALALGKDKREMEQFIADRMKELEEMK